MTGELHWWIRIGEGTAFCPIVEGIRFVGALTNLFRKSSRSAPTLVVTGQLNTGHSKVLCS
jgi:hypothetical protein